MNLSYMPCISFPKNNNTSINIFFVFVHFLLLLLLSFYSMGLALNLLFGSFDSVEDHKGQHRLHQSRAIGGLDTFGIWFLKMLKQTYLHLYNYPVKNT